MKSVVISAMVLQLFFGISSEALAKYWVIQEDFLKIGKKEIYEEEKKKRLGPKNLTKAIGMEDLENSQYVFFTPLEKLSFLETLFPFQEKVDPLLSSCLHYTIFSLHQWLSKASFRADLVFSKDFPYSSYVLYDIIPGFQDAFEEHLQKIVAKQSSGAPSPWSAWKVVMGADTPKYLLCAAFASKGQLKDAHLEELWEEPLLKEILRNKKSGWLKQSESFVRK